jgi:hypothetical protein
MHSQGPCPTGRSQLAPIGAAVARGFPAAYPKHAPKHAPPPPSKGSHQRSRRGWRRSRAPCRRSAGRAQRGPPMAPPPGSQTPAPPGASWRPGGWRRAGHCKGQAGRQASRARGVSLKSNQSSGLAQGRRAGSLGKTAGTRRLEGAVGCRASHTRTHVAKAHVAKALSKVGARTMMTPFWLLSCCCRRELAPLTADTSLPSREGVGGFSTS